MPNVNIGSLIKNFPVYKFDAKNPILRRLCNNGKIVFSDTDCSYFHKMMSDVEFLYTARFILDFTDRDKWSRKTRKAIKKYSRERLELIVEEWAQGLIDSGRVPQTVIKDCSKLAINIVDNIIYFQALIDKSLIASISREGIKQ